MTAGAVVTGAAIAAGVGLAAYAIVPEIVRLLDPPEDEKAETLEAERLQRSIDRRLDELLRLTR